MGGPLHGSSLNEGIMGHYIRILIHISIITMDMYSFQNIMYLQYWTFINSPICCSAGRLNIRKKILIVHLPTTNNYYDDHFSFLPTFKGNNS